MTTAHPHHDPERNELVNYIARFSRVSEYVLYGLPAGSSQRRVIASCRWSGRPTCTPSE